MFTHTSSYMAYRVSKSYDHNHPPSIPLIRSVHCAIHRLYMVASRVMQKFPCFSLARSLYWPTVISPLAINNLNATFDSLAATRFGTRCRDPSSRSWSRRRTLVSTSFLKMRPTHGVRLMDCGQKLSDFKKTVPKMNRRRQGRTQYNTVTLPVPQTRHWRATRAMERRTAATKRRLSRQPSKPSHQPPSCRQNETTKSLQLWSRSAVRILVPLRIHPRPMQAPTQVQTHH